MATGSGMGCIPTLPAMKSVIPEKDREYSDDDIIGSTETCVYGIVSHSYLHHALGHQIMGIDIL